MIYGFSPHSPAATEALRTEVLPCRRKGCGCIPYDHSKHSKKAREARIAREASLNETADVLVDLIGAAVVRTAGLEPATSSL